MCVLVIVVVRVVSLTEGHFGYTVDDGTGLVELKASDDVDAVDAAWPMIQGAVLLC